jgi:branched-chain amino acid transport system substrate-binding protein
MGVAVAAALTLLVSACGGTSAALSGSSSEAPLKIGILTNKAGVLATTAADAMRGYELAVDEAPTKYLKGRKVQLVTTEFDGTPAGAVAAVTQMVQQQGVKLLTGPNTTAQALAFAPVATRLGAVWIDSTSQGEETTGAQCQPSFFRVVTDVNQLVNIADQSMKESGIKEWAFIGSDYALGQDMSVGVKAKVEALGGKLTTNVLAPLGTADFGSAISQLAGDPATGLITALAGSDAATFSKQAVQFDLFAKYKTVIGDGLLGNVPQSDLGAVAPKMTNSIEIASLYDATLPSPEAASFLAMVKAKYPNDDYVDFANRSAKHYNALTAYVQATAKAGSDDALKVRQALAGGQFDFAQGPATIRAADHQVQVNGVVTAAVEQNGGWRFKVVKTYDAVSVTAPAQGCSL